MKFKILTLLVLIIIFSTLIISRENRNRKGKKTVQTVQVSKDVKQSDFFIQQSPGKAHSTQKLNCKTCHNCEYPTKDEPCLIYCPREGIISVHHTPDECPEIIVFDEMSRRFGAVVFSHKLHAQMAEMSDGCQGCHHYNTTGPVLACKKCHEQGRRRENIRRVDLKGAYHRQCMSCHRQWSHTTDCYSCHLPKNGTQSKTISKKVSEIKGKEHPKAKLPDKIIFETSYKKGKLVTFFHEDHIKLFNSPCVTCHRHENCIKCHDWNNKLTHSLLEKHKTQKVHLSFDDHHRPCLACHKQNNCEMCHSEKELLPWSHDKSTSFALKHYHDKLPCESCHTRKNQFDKISIECRDCHKDWKKGNFNHKVTGLILDDNHKELDCEDCHDAKKFTTKPTCSNCHDDKFFPKYLPGKIINLTKNNGKKGKMN